MAIDKSTLDKYVITYHLKKAHSDYYEIEKGIERYLQQFFTYYKYETFEDKVFFYGVYANGKMNHTVINIYVSSTDAQIKLQYKELMSKISHDIYENIVMKKISTDEKASVSAFNVSYNNAPYGWLDDHNKLVFRKVIKNKDLVNETPNPHLNVMSLKQ